jgi:hypothetical protein
MSALDVINDKDTESMQGGHIILQLTYISRFNNDNKNGELERILSQAQTNNRENGVTGALVFNSDYFLQSIEGSRPVINSLLRKLIRDERHFALQIIEAREVDQRRWTSWSMKYLSPSTKNQNYFLKYSAGTTFNPYLMSANQVMMLVDTLSRLQESEDL